jgi:hypothetical protein
MSMNASLPSQVSSFVSVAANPVCSQAPVTSASAGTNLAAQATSAAGVAALATPVLVGAVSTAALGGMVYAIPELKEKFQSLCPKTSDKVLLGVLVGAGIATAYAVTGAAVTAALGAGVVCAGAKMLHNMKGEKKRIKIQEETVRSNQEEMIKRGFKKLPTFNSVRTLVKLDEAAKKPPVIGNEPLKIKMHEHNGIVAAALQLIARPSFMERLPKAIQSRLAEEDLFGEFGVEGIYRANPDMSYEKKGALVRIGSLMRGSEINSKRLDLLLEQLLILQKDGLPTKGLDVKQQKAIKELSFLLGLRKFFIDNQKKTDKPITGHLFRLLDPKMFEGEMKDWDPLNVLREMTQLLEDEPTKEKTHRVQYCVASNHGIQFDKAPDLVVHQLTKKMVGTDYFKKIRVGAEIQQYSMQEEGGYLCWNAAGANRDHATATVFRNGKAFHCDNLVPLEEQNKELSAKELPQLDRAYLVMAGKVPSLFEKIQKAFS